MLASPPRHLIGVLWGQGEKARRPAVANGVRVGAVQCEGMKVDVQVERRALPLKIHFAPKPLLSARFVETGCRYLQ